MNRLGAFLPTGMWLALALVIAVAARAAEKAALTWPKDDDQAQAEVERLAGIGERVPSDDAAIQNFHSIGLVCGQANIFRSACPMRDLAETPPTMLSDEQKLAEAKARMKHLYELGVRTVITFEDPHKIDEGDIPYPSGQEHPTIRASVALERPAAEFAGIRYISHPIINAGKDSLEDMSSEDLEKLLDEHSREIFEYAQQGGVLYHCSAGHDRTGIVTAYIRLKYQHWPVDEAIAEMRRYGHNWLKYSHEGEQSSWHEAHLRTIAARLSASSLPEADKSAQNGEPRVP